MDGTVVAFVHHEGGVFGVSFPDFPGVVTAGSSAEEALARAADILSFHVAGMMEDGDQIPVNRALEELQADPQFGADANGATVALVPLRIRSENA